MATKAIPTMTFEVAVIELTDRDHNRYAREALSEAVSNHFDRNIRKHFRAGNRFRYDHAKRSPFYVKKKREVTGQQVDLVKSGASRSFVPRVKRLRVSGSATTASTRGFSARVESFWPFPGGKTGRRKDGSTGVTIQQMSAEAATWAADEVGPALQDFANRYVQKVQHHYATRRRKPYRVSFP